MKQPVKKQLHVRGKTILAGIVIVAAIAVGLIKFDIIAVAQNDTTARQASGGVSFPSGELVVDTGSGPLSFSVEIARTRPQRARGLMFRTSLDADRGMIFIYESPREISMWMKNTILSLDMLFIAADGRIARIVADTTPMSEMTISSRGPVRAVLELSAGAAKRFSIKPGDRINLDAFTG